MTVPPDPAAPPAPGKTAGNGTGRDLALFGAFAAFLALLSLSAYLWLQDWKARADALPVVRYEQPVWSDTGQGLAYVRIQVAPGTDEVLGREVWSVDRFGEQHRLLAALPGPARLVGWLDGERHVVARLETAEGEGTVLLDLHGDGSGGRRVRFPEPGLRLVGRSGAQLLLEKPVGAEADGRAGLEIMTWSPGTDRLQHLVRIPSPKDEEVRVEQVAPAPNGRHLALVLRARPPEGPLGVWILDRETGHLQFTLISAEDARTMRADWSPGSDELVAAAWRPDRSEIYVVHRPLDALPDRLRTPAGDHPLTPLWPRDGHRVLLLAGDMVLEADFEKRRAEMVLSARGLGLVPEELALSPLGGLAAFHVRDGDQDELYLSPLRGARPTAVAVPERRRQARGSLLYSIADGMRYAVGLWLGGGDPAPEHGLAETTRGLGAATGR